MSACTGLGLTSPRASEGDIALCYYTRDTERGLKSRGEGGLLDDARDGELIGRAITAEGTPLGSSQRKAVVSRCRQLGVFN